MNNRELETKIRNAYENIAPDVLDSVLSDCSTQKGQLIIMKEKKKSNHNIRYIAGLAAALLLVFGGIRFYQGKFVTASTVLLDVNPSIEIRLNKSEEVLSVQPLNADAETVIGNMDFSGSSLDVTLNALIGSMLRNGYISDAANSILVTVDSDDPAEGHAMQTRLMAEIDTILESGNVSGAVLGQTVTKDEEIRRLAEQYGITAGKAKLILQITQQNTLYSFADLVPLTINELNLISESGGTKLENIDSIGTASASAYIGDTSAKAAACDHAGIPAENAERVKCELDWENGMMVYEVDFAAGGYEYEYEINAKSGEVIKFEREKDEFFPLPGKAESKTVSSASASGYIGEEEAKQAAFRHADISESDVIYCICKPDREHGVAIYELEFAANGYEYDYDVNAETGEIVKYSKEKSRTFYTGSSDTAQRPGANSDSTASVGIDGEVDEAAAKEIALNHAGVSEVSFYRCKLDFEHGKAVYEISFRVGGYEYEYEISVADGEILKSEKEKD